MLIIYFDCFTVLRIKLILARNIHVIVNQIKLQKTVFYRQMQLLLLLDNHF